MAAYTVHEPPDPPADRVERAERLVFVKDGFSFVAALFAPFWMAAHRMWTALALYLALAIGLSLVLTVLKTNELWAMLAQVGLALIVGLEADSIRRWSLERKGAELIGTVTANNMNEAERRFFEVWLPMQPVLRRGETGGPRPQGTGQPATPQPAQQKSPQPAAATVARSTPGAAAQEPPEGHPALASASMSASATAPQDARPRKRRWWRLGGRA